MNTVKQLLHFLNEVAPPQYQESYDNSGLLIGSTDLEIKGVLVCLDATEEVISEAISSDCNVVVAHHPILFSGLKKITGQSYIEKAIIKAIKNDIAIIAVHTNLDNMYFNGVNTKISEKLGLTETKILQPKTLNGQLAQHIGSGMIGHLKEEMSPEMFLLYLKEKMEVSCIKYTPYVDKIKTVALCGGSGRFLLERAISAKADVFISSDFKYHEYFDANGKIMIADIGHYESEQYTIELLHGLITDNFSKFATHCTKVNTNPVNYYV